MKTAKNILCLQAITTLGLPMRRRYSGLRQKRYAGERAARAAALQQAQRLKPANWKNELAEFKHTESALVFNTGYMTNLGVLFARLNRAMLFSATS